LQTEQGDHTSALVGYSPEVRRLLGVAYRAGWPVGVDTETEGCDPKKQSPYENARIVVWSLGIPTDARGSRGQRLAQRVLLLPVDLAPLRAWLEGPAPKILHNRLYDRHAFRNAGILLAGDHDSADLHRLVDPEGKHGLKELMGRLLGYTPVCEFTDFCRPVVVWKSRKSKTELAVCTACEGSGYVTYVAMGERCASECLACGGKEEGLTPTGRKRKAKPGSGWVPAVEEYQVTLKRTELIPLREIVPGHPDWDRLVDYATLDAKATAELYDLLVCLLGLPVKIPGTETCTTGTAYELYLALFQPFTDLLFEMAVTGITIDAEFCQREAKRAREDGRALRAEIREWDGPLWEVNHEEPLNWRSSKQEVEFLHTVLGLPKSPVCKKGNVRKGKTAVDAEAIEYIADHCTDPVIKENLRKVLKLKNIWSSLKYLDKLPRFMDARGRIHPVCGWTTKTGRLAMRCPEGQQIPKDKRKDSYNVRAAFTAAPGKVLVARDASQLEMRIQAHLHLKLFGDGKLAADIDAADCHSANAIMVFGAVYPDKVLTTGERFADLPLTTNLKKHPDPWAQQKRDDIKRVIYGLAYGKGAYGLGATLRDEAGEPIGEPAAQRILDALFVVYPAIPKLQAWIESFVTENGYIQSLLGRRRTLPDAKSPDRWRVKRACRQALNNPMQAGAADLVMLWMLLCRRDAELCAVAVMLLQCHDELLFECDPSVAEWVGERVEHWLQVAGRILGLLIAIKGSGVIGVDWSCDH
jgi:DNA polymerase I-like protein with 3'-5' exonuclease and polymerase domains